MSCSKPPCSELPPEQMMSVPQPLEGITEANHSHLQQMIQTHLEPHAGPASGPHDACVISPLTPAQAIDLSTSGEDYCCQVMPGETPLSHGLVPNFVLARIRDEENLSTPPESASKQRKNVSSAKVCLEKRFNTLSVDNTQQDIQSAVFSSFFSMLRQSAEPQNAVFNAEKQKNDTGNALCVMNTNVMGLHDPVLNICGQVVALVEPSQPQHFMLPKTFTFNFHPERIVAKASSSSNTAQEDAEATLAASRSHSIPHHFETAKASKAGSDSARRSRSKVRKGTQPCMSISQRKEVHNSKERARRRKIRLCCDQLNTLVPFCDTNSDKVTTLQGAVAFLRYISETYGDTLKEEFEVFSHRKGLFLKSGSSFSLGPILEEVDDTHSVPLGVEQ